MDHVTEKTNCELHVTMRNISVKVAVGYVYPTEEGAMYHHESIPAGYARVGVDDIVKEFETMELDHPGGDDEKTPLDVKRGFALWKKQNIVLSDPLSRPPTRPCSSPPQQQRPSTPPRRSPPQQQRPWTPPHRSPPQQQSPHLPERDPSASPPSRYPPREEEPVKRTGSPVRKKLRKDTTPPPIQKLPLEKNDEKPAAIVMSEVAAIVYPGQSVPPLKVFDDRPVQSSRQHIGSPITEVAYKYVLGENLVENVRSLPPRMRTLHTWYRNATKTGIQGLMVGVKEEHYFQEYAVNVDFAELFKLYNLRALEKSILSCYCL